MPDLPRLIDRYEVIERLGRGGMGELYLTNDPIFDRYVVIKVLRAGFEGDQLRQRFAREARSATRLAHVNIAAIFDVGEHEGLPYLAMEYVPGETLSEIVRRKTELPLGTKLNYIDELCAGLAHAHRAGIVHRDIKPSNLMVSRDGTLKILDFGVARFTDSSMTGAGMAMATLNYMSPEQITGQPIDHRADIFAVGAVFYEVIAYQQAFPGGIQTGVLSRIMEGRFAPLTNAVDPHLARVIEKALARNPDDRYPDLAVLREDLARARQRIDPRVLAPHGDDEVDDKTLEIPLTTPWTPRKGTDRSEIRRRREEEFRNALNAAREAFADHRFEEASAACERVLIIQPDNEEALYLIERAREVIDRQQFREWFSQAQTAFARGDLARAQDLVSVALSFDARSADAGKLRNAIDKANRRRELESAIERGRTALGSGDVLGARAAAQVALGLDPAEDRAVALKRAVDAHEDRQREVQQGLRPGVEEMPGVLTDRVHFSVAAPPKVAPGTAFIVEVWAHLETQRAEVERRIDELSHRLERIAEKGPIVVARGTVLTLRIRAPDLIIDDPEDTIVWYGEIGKASFPVKVPADATFGDKAATITVHAGGLQVAKLHATLTVAHAPAGPQSLPVRHSRHRTAYACYASRDRDEVLLVLQGLQKGVPGLDVFLDVATLRSGDRWQERLTQEICSRDVLYLFWSDAARQSPWVEREWRCGYENRGVDFIDPVPLVSPADVPPPRELAELHFYDWLLAYKARSAS